MHWCHNVKMVTPSGHVCTHQPREQKREIEINGQESSPQISGRRAFRINHKHLKLWEMASLNCWDPKMHRYIQFHQCLIQRYLFDTVQGAPNNPDTGRQRFHSKLNAGLLASSREILPIIPSCRNSLVSFRPKWKLFLFFRDSDRDWRCNWQMLRIPFGYLT